jgi:hypothetical protein
LIKISKKDQPPRAVRLIRAALAELMELPDPENSAKSIGSGVGVYAYFDYDGEPIYVGQTSSTFRDRVSRHLTGQRSDAVAKFILDPFEVADVELWSVPAVADARKQDDPAARATVAQKRRLLAPYEYTVYKTLEKQSRFRAVLNEGSIAVHELVELPQSVRGRIIPAELWEDRKHTDLRIARRASTISRLSQMISERQVSGGMRRTLSLQARRLSWLADHRMHEVGVEKPSAEDLAIDDD